MSTAWVHLEDTLTEVDRRLQAEAADVSVWWRGFASDSLLRTWASYATNLPRLREQVGELAAILHSTSRAIQSAQDDYDHTVEIVGAVTLATGAAAFFTFGLSELGEAATVEGAAATLEELLATLGQTLARIASMIAEALSAMGRIADELSLTIGGRSTLALAGGGAVPGLGGLALTGGQLLVGGLAVAGGAVTWATADALLAKGFGSGGYPSAGGGGSEVRYPDDQVPREYSATSRSINHVASEHGDNFGFIRKTPTASMKAEFDQFMRDWVMDPEHKQIVGTFRRQEAVFYLEEETYRVVVLHPNGALWTGFRLTKAEMANLILTGGFG